MYFKGVDMMLTLGCGYVKKKGVVMFNQITDGVVMFKKVWLSYIKLQS